MALRRFDSADGCKTSVKRLNQNKIQLNKNLCVFYLDGSNIIANFADVNKKIINKED
nr:MAG TPA: hypothetical protein [Caudoviricetes sp.]